MKKKSKKNKAVIFDIDGVIVDTRKSYLEAIRITVDLYLTKILGISEKGSPLLTLKDVESFKMLGGVNNDWDCVESILSCFLPFLGNCSRRGAVTRVSISDLKKNKGVLTKVRTYKKRIDYKKIVEIFQQVYLGPKVYKSCYKKKALYWKRAGLYLKEKLLLSPGFFRSLKKSGFKLGIATGRTRFETLMVLKRFGLLSFFDSVVTADEAKAGRSKPHPFILQINAKKLGVKKMAYMGDIPDDIRTARNAVKTGLDVKAIGFLKGVSERSAMRRSMRRAGRAAVLTSPARLRKLLKTI
jgi:HAD superfamily hydrolase (TIGR01548 family)